MQNSGWRFHRSRGTSPGEAAKGTVSEECSQIRPLANPVQLPLDRWPLGVPGARSRVGSPGQRDCLAAGGGCRSRSRLRVCRGCLETGIVGSAQEAPAGTAASCPRGGVFARSFCRPLWASLAPIGMSAQDSNTHMWSGWGKCWKGMWSVSRQRERKRV